MAIVIVVDLGFGDAGKGTVVDWLCARGPEPAGAVVRFNGGAQAAHNVVTVDGRHHTFAQFGSGTFTSGVRTHLSRFMMVDPLALAAEARHLAGIGVPDALDRLTVDRDALLTTPYHRAANRARERRRGEGRHGSCGLGVGETMAYHLAHPGEAPRVGDCRSRERLRLSLGALRDRVLAEFPETETGGELELPSLAGCLDAFLAFGERVRLVDGAAHLSELLRTGDVVFEGAQGVLLDEWHGFHPYTTWSTTTFANVETLLAEAGGDDLPAIRLGVTRAYQVRHGPGPFPTEDPVLTADLPDPHNRTGRWQGAFRVGHLDAVATGYAVAACGGVDALAVTHLDVVAARRDLRICRAYEIESGIEAGVGAEVAARRVEAGMGDEIGCGIGGPAVVVEDATDGAGTLGVNDLRGSPLAGKVVDRLVPGPPCDLDRQRRLTERLLTARPIYDGTWLSGPGDPAAIIEDVLGIPVALTSFGPTVEDKRVRAEGLITSA